jgi:hypothetical protein
MASRYIIFNYEYFICDIIVKENSLVMCSCACHHATFLWHQFIYCTMNAVSPVIISVSTSLKLVGIIIII